MYNYSIYKEEKFIHILFSKASLEEIFKVFSEIRNHSDFNHGYNGIVDLRNAELSLEIKDLHEIAKFIHSSPWVKGKWVLINDNPGSMVLSVLYKELTHTFHSIEVCSTIDKASEILETDISKYY